MATGLFFTLVSYWVTNMIIIGAMVGRPRKPITGGEAVASMLISALLIVALFIWGNPQ